MTYGDNMEVEIVFTTGPAKYKRLNAVLDIAKSSEFHLTLYTKNKEFFVPLPSVYYMSRKITSDEKTKLSGLLSILSQKKRGSKR